MHRGVVPRRNGLYIAVPAGRDVAVRPLEDDEHLPLAHPVDLVIRPPDMTHDGEVIAIVVEQHRVVRRDEPVGT
ncbi:hypothetical protein D3C73_1619120 [compost metagenome]